MVPCSVWGVGGGPNVRGNIWRGWVGGKKLKEEVGKEGLEKYNNKSFHKNKLTHGIVNNTDSIVHGTLQYSTAQYSTVRYNILDYTTVHYSLHYTDHSKEVRGGIILYCIGLYTEGGIQIN